MGALYITIFSAIYLQYTNCIIWFRMYIVRLDSTMLSREVRRSIDASSYVCLVFCWFGYPYKMNCMSSLFEWCFNSLETIDLLTNARPSCVYDPHTTISKEEPFLQSCSSNSEAFFWRNVSSVLLHGHGMQKRVLLPSCQRPCTLFWNHSFLSSHCSPWSKESLFDSVHCCSISPRGRLDFYVHGESMTNCWIVLIICIVLSVFQKTSASVFLKILKRTLQDFKKKRKQMCNECNTF